jgi:hypothetical protein
LTFVLNFNQPEGVIHCWNMLIEDFGITPDDGLCIQVLNTAARAGLPDLASSVLQALKTAAIPWAEEHLAPLLEAFCNGSRLKDAFLALEIASSSGVEPRWGTLRPLVAQATVDIDSLYGAKECLEEISQEQGNLDVSAVNVVIEASLHFNDLQHAISTYKACTSYRTSPNLQTFRLLLAGALQADHGSLGNALFSDLKETGLSPTSDILEIMIQLHLKQATYEDAFFFLEECKATGAKPSIKVYEQIVDRCVRAGDSRYLVALEEMEDQGYAVGDDRKAGLQSLYEAIRTRHSQGRS